MKLSRRACKIIGVRVGEATLNLLNPSAATLYAKFFLLRDPDSASGVNVGAYSKVAWSDRTLEALQKLIDCMEDDALIDIFDDEGESTATSTESSGLSFPPVPVLGGSKRDTP
jgi:hypothetical protein